MKKKTDLEVDGKLPDNVIPIRTLKSTRNRPKHCQCYDVFFAYPKKLPRFELDENNREVYCQHCGEKVDAFDALVALNENWKLVSDEVTRLLDQAKEIKDYKPWLLKIREFAKQYGRGEYIPTCPNCHNPMTLEELIATGWVYAKDHQEAEQFKKGGADGHN